MKHIYRQLILTGVAMLVIGTLMFGGFDTVSAQTRSRGCAFSALSELGLRAGDLRDNTGHPIIDSNLTRELSLLYHRFPVRPRLFFLNDNPPNAFATSQVIDQASPYLDGSVMIGLNLMMEEWRNSRSGNTYSLAGIMAHEFGHIMQFKRGWRLRGKWMELHADYLAGWYVALRSEWAITDPMEVFPRFAQKGDDNFNHPDHHGTPQERESAIRAGYAAGMSKVNADQAYAQGERYLKDLGAPPGGTGSGQQGGVSGASQSSSDGDKEFRTAVQRLIEASRSGFSTVRGARKTRVDEVTMYASRVALPRAIETEVWISTGGDPPLVYCEMFKGEDKDEAERIYKDILERLKASVPSSWSAKERSGSGSIVKFCTLRQGALGPLVDITLSQSYRDDYRVSVKFMPKEAYE